MERLNYGLALDSEGGWAVIDTVHAPGIRDDYTRISGRSFTYFVAPATFVDHYLNLDSSAPGYLERRRGQFKANESVIKRAILSYHGKSERVRLPRPSWSNGRSFGNLIF